MKRIALVAAVALALPAAAPAKGPSGATITGPGLDGTVAFEPYGDLSGLYQQSLRPDRPAGELGPRYEAAWTFSYPGRRAEVVRQHVYPYARPYPVTYTPPGQRLWGRVYEGGWYVSSPRLKDVLVAAGLPAEPPSRPGVWPWLGLAPLGLAVCFAPARWISATRTRTASSASTSSTPTTGRRSSTAAPPPASQR